jgi:hypothetical protein
VNIRVAGERLKSDDGETWFLPKGLIAPEMLVNELPEEETFELRLQSIHLPLDGPVTPGFGDGPFLSICT